MQVLENVSPGEPVRTFTLNLTEREMGILVRALGVVDVPSMDLEDRSRFWELFTAISLNYRDYRTAQG